MINFKSVAEKMLIDFKDTANIPHQGVKGRARESIIFEQYLRPYIPPRYAISTGLIFDIENNSSRQQDLVIYDEFNTPILKDLNGEKLFFPESVFTVIEVKSILTPHEVEDIVQKSISVWTLKRTPLDQAVLTPNFVLPTVNSLPLCVGFAYESKIGLDDALANLRKLRSTIPSSSALSVLCILHDKNGKSGLIVNVSEQDSTKVIIIPTPKSRLAILNCASMGDALLYLYIILMEHLRNIGILNPAPNLLEYAKISNLATPTLHVPMEEARGTSVVIKGHKANFDDMELMRRLTLKLAADDITDDEIIEWFYLIRKIPDATTEFAFHDQSRFYDEKGLLEMPSPIETYKAVERYRNNTLTPEDSEKASALIKLIRSANKEQRTIFIGYFESGKPAGFFINPSKTFKKKG